MKQQHNRNTKIDTLKGVAIFLVVWGHIAGLFGCTYDDELSKFLTSFNMPLFAVISGVLFNPPERGKLLD